MKEKIMELIEIASLAIYIAIGLVVGYVVHIKFNMFGANHVTVSDILATYILSMLAFVFLWFITIVLIKTKGKQKNG